MRFLGIGTQAPARAWTVEIAQTGKTFTVPHKTTVLQAALDAGVKFPNECRVGSCTTCKSRLLEGKVKELSDTAYVLSQEDLRDGYILACQSIPQSDLRLELGKPRRVAKR